MTRSLVRPLTRSLTRSLLRGPSLDADAAAYIAELVSAGATVTSVQSDAIDTFIRAEKDGGRWDIIKRMYLPIWELAAPNAICMRSLTSGTFVGGVTHGTKGVRSDGSTGYFDAGTSMAGAGCLLDSSSMFYLGADGPLTLLSTQGIGGSQDELNASRAFLSRRSSAAGPNSATALEADDASDDYRMVFIASRTSSSNRYICRRRTAFEFLKSDSASSGSIATVNNVCFLARNVNGTIGGFTPSGLHLGAYGMGLGFELSESDGFSANLKKLWEDCTPHTLT